MSYNGFSNMSSSEVAIYIAIMLAITALCYCTIPIILKFTLMRKREFSKGTLTGIAIACTALGFIVFLILNYPDVGSFWPAIIWGCVNIWILRSCDPTNHTNSDVAEAMATTDEAPIISADSKKGSLDDVADKQKKTALMPSKSTAPINKKALPKSTKVCIGIIIAIVAIVLIGGIAAYHYVTVDYYNDAYNSGYGDGHVDGYNEAHGF